MNELVNLIVNKTHIPAATAQTIVNVVLDFLKKKLPAPMAAEVVTLLNNDADVKEAENLIGEASSLFGKKK